MKNRSKLFIPVIAASMLIHAVFFSVLYIRVFKDWRHHEWRSFTMIIRQSDELKPDKPASLQYENPESEPAPKKVSTRKEKSIEHPKELKGKIISENKEEKPPLEKNNDPAGTDGGKSILKSSEKNESRPASKNERNQELSQAAANANSGADSQTGTPNTYKNTTPRFDSGDKGAKAGGAAPRGDNSGIRGGPHTDYIQKKHAGTNRGESKEGTTFSKGRAGGETASTAAGKEQSAALRNSPIEAYRKKISALIDANKKYPPLAREMKAAGTAKLSFIIDRKGAVGDLKVAVSSGYKMLDDAAENAVGRVGAFPPPPAEISGDKIKMTVSIVFKIE